MARNRMSVAWTILLLGLAGCAVEGNWIAPGVVEIGPAPRDSVAGTVIVVGDAGEAIGAGRSQVLDAVAADAALAPASTWVVFVGDNVYPDTSPGTFDREAKLDAQIDAVLLSGANGIFLLGNHDHRCGDLGRWERDHIAMRLDAAVLTGRARPGQVRLLPEHASLGPSFQDVADVARLAFLDTELWLCDADADGFGCRTASEELRHGAGPRDGRCLVVFGHHPTASNGPHGRFFSWRDWLLFDGLGVPLPFPLSIVGVGIYDFGSSVSDVFGGTDWAQNLHNPRYCAFSGLLDDALADCGAVAYVAGHEHSLQWISNARANRRGAPFEVVSGAGSPGKLNSVGASQDTLFASSEPGYVRLEFLTDGSVRLEFAEVIDGCPRPRRSGFRLEEPEPGAATAR